MIQSISRDGTDTSTFDQSDIRGFRPHDLVSSRSCLALVAEVRLLPIPWIPRGFSRNVVASPSMLWMYVLYANNDLLSTDLLGIQL